MKILMPDGAVYHERIETMVTHSPDFKAVPISTGAASIGGGIITATAEPVARTIAVVAAELEASIAAAGRVKALTEELHGLLGRKTRKARKVAP